MNNSPTKIENLKHNVHGSAAYVMRVQADIDRTVYDYLFNHIAAYNHGARQNLTTFFFQRLYEECQRLGIPRVWDETSEAKLVEVLNRLNFAELKPTTKKAKKSK